MVAMAQAAGQWVVRDICLTGQMQWWLVIMHFLLFLDWEFGMLGMIYDSNGCVTDNYSTLGLWYIQPGARVLDPLVLPTSQTLWSRQPQPKHHFISHLSYSDWNELLFRLDLLPLPFWSLILFVYYLAVLPLVTPANLRGPFEDHYTHWIPGACLLSIYLINSVRQQVGVS